MAVTSEYGLTVKAGFINCIRIIPWFIVVCNEFRRCFREELEPAGYFNVYAKRFTLYPVDDNTCGVSNNIKIFKERE